MDDAINNRGSTETNLTKTPHVRSSTHHKQTIFVKIDRLNPMIDPMAYYTKICVK